MPSGWHAMQKLTSLCSLRCLRIKKSGFMKVRAACILTFRIFPPVNPARCYQGVSESPPDARSGRFRSQLFPITDVLSNRKLMFFNNPSPVRKATNHFHGVISVVTSAERPLMLSQLRLPDSPRIAATIHWRYLSSRQTTLLWRGVAQALRARLPAGDQIPLQ